MNNVPRRLLCFRLRSSDQDLRDRIWLYVERSGGHMSIGIDCIDFFVPARAVSFLVLAYDELERREDLDYL